MVTADAAQCELSAHATVDARSLLLLVELIELRGEGYPVRDEDLVHLSPARYEHINPYGKYRFEVDEELGRTELRPLRHP